jgi:hypothetical protein
MWPRFFTTLNDASAAFSGDAREMLIFQLLIRVLCDMSSGPVSGSSLPKKQDFRRPAIHKVGEVAGLAGYLLPADHNLETLIRQAGNQNALT